MRKIKPKPLAKRLEAALRATAGAESACATMGLKRRDARAILAALEHAKQAEREACAMAAEKEASEWCGSPYNECTACNTVATIIRGRKP